MHVDCMAIQNHVWLEIMETNIQYPGIKPVICIDGIPYSVATIGGIECV